MTIMTFVWAGGKIGIAYYLLDTGEMYVLPDTSESSPDFYVLRSLFRQIMPRYLVMNASQDEKLRKVAHEICGENIRAESETGDPTTSLEDSKLVTLHSKMFSPENCKRRLLAVKLPFEPKDSSDVEHELFISSLIPIRSEKMIRAAGALLQYLDTRGGELFQLELVEGHVPVLNIIPCTMDGIVMVDDTAWKSLQIFNLDIHPSTIKQANHSGSKEGISVFSMLSQSCCTVQGSKALRLMLLRPSRNVEVLNRRYDVIEYCNNPRNLEFTKSAADCLKAMKSLPKLLYKLTLLHASVSEWKDLYQTMYHCVLLGEICSAQPQSVALFSEISHPENLRHLKLLCQEMIRVIDFEESASLNRIVARQGIDNLIDTKKKQYACLPNIMNLVAREEMAFLPGFIHKCCVVYIPEVGYLLSITLWRENLTVEEVELENLEFRFKTSESAYYKTPRTKELDVILGDCYVAILEMETSIMIALTETILSHSTMILNMGNLVSEIDCLMSMSSVARNGNFVRPQIVSDEQKLKIVNGRHPLVAEICDFVPNTTRLDGEQKIVMITGPNASGKSIYLKQVSVITIMALSGSFVPATSCRIPTFDRICTRIHATESVSTGFSSFMIDLIQMSFALRTTSKQSLVIIDEFGKGTAEADGLSLLAASIEDFLLRGEDSPTVFFSTHFYSLLNYIRPSPVLKTQSMKFLHQTLDSYHTITYLYELVDGICPSSLAHLVAEQIGIPTTLILRSVDVEKVIKHQLEEQWLVPVSTSKQIEEHAMQMELANFFLKVNPETENPITLFTKFKAALSTLLE